MDERLIELLKFGLGYTDQLKDDWWALDYEGKLECQQLLFPGGIYINSSKKVDTTTINPIYSLIANKKAPENASDAFMVELAVIATASDG